MTFAKLSDSISFAMQAAHPELTDMVSISEASKVIFGVKTLQHLIHIHPEDRNALLAFFKDNVSDLVEWSKHCNPGKYERESNPEASPKFRWEYYSFQFYARDDMFSGYKVIAKELGIKIAVKITQHRECNDIIAAYKFIRENKKLYTKFQKQVVPAFAAFPESAHLHMIHDFGMQAMKRAEYAENKGKGGSRQVAITLRQPTAEMPEVKGFKILIPRNESDLRKIGNAQNHCVGRAGMGYGRRIQEQKIWIAAIYKEGLSDGICVEIDCKDGKILQAQGALRRSPTDAEQTAIKKVNKHLTGFQKKYNSHW